MGDANVLCMTSMVNGVSPGAGWLTILAAVEVEAASDVGADRRST